MPREVVVDPPGRCYRTAYRTLSVTYFPRYRCGHLSAARRRVCRCCCLWGCWWWCGAICFWGWGLLWVRWLITSSIFSSNNLPLGLGDVLRGRCRGCRRTVMRRGLLLLLQLHVEVLLHHVNHVAHAAGAMSVTYLLLLWGVLW